MSVPEAERPGAAWRTRSPGGGPEYGAAYGRTIDSLRTFLDRFAQAVPGEELLGELGETLDQWSDRLEPLGAPERQRVYGRRQELPGRGQVTSPQFFADSENDQEVTGRVRFGQYFLGGNMAAHGGTLPLFFDELLGRLAQSGRTACRTAYLRTDYRSITPIGPELTARAWVVEETGRKRFLRGTLHHGDVLCAEADALFVELRPGQP